MKKAQLGSTGLVPGMTEKKPDANIYTMREFKSLVRYERTRSDRSGSVFSVAVFQPKQRSGEQLKSLVSVLSQLTRSIDCIGADDKGKIPVLLPDTVKNGANVFGDKVSMQLKNLLDTQVDFSVYTYPENWLATDKGGSRSFRPRFKGAPQENDVELFFVDAIPAWKRALDLSVSSILLVLGAPLILLLGIYIKIVSPGPVFFTQDRVGYRGIPFKFWKLRTMRMDNDQAFHGAHAQSFISSGDVPMLKLDSHDPRIIPGGKVIRKCCLDELPQLWNVIIGDMSLVGPRPCIPYEAKEYLRWHTQRFDVLPGLSGLWQVSGKNKLTFKQMIRLDIAYCQSMSLLNDVIIILKTPVAILKMVMEAIEGKYQPRLKDALNLPVSAEQRGVAN